jgi:hypothetical protein
MKFSTNREALLAACRLAGRLLPEHPINPAEEHFLLRAAAVEEVYLEANAGSVVLRWPGTRYKLESPSPANFPPFNAASAARDNNRPLPESETRAEGYARQVVMLPRRNVMSVLPSASPARWTGSSLR